MKVMLYPFEDVDIWCFAKEDRLAKIEAYLKCHDPNLHYTGVFDRMIYEKIKFYPAAKTKRGELFLKTIVNAAYGKSEYMLQKDVYYNFLFLCRPDEMNMIYRLSDEKKNKLYEYLKKLYNLDDNLDEIE